MDMLKFFGITHREHLLLNPASEEEVTRLAGLLRLRPDAHVVDIGCGKGEFLIRLAEAYGVRCTGVDISPYFLEAARSNFQTRLPGGNVTLLQMNGADFKPDKPHSFALAACIGASWIFGGHTGTLDALISMVEPGGWVIVGEPYWLQEPSEEYLKVSGDTRESFGTHGSNVEAGEQRGLELVYTIVSSKELWDRYEGLQWYATAEYARTHPDDPDLPEIIERVAKNKATYLRWGRDTLGWAVYVFRSPGSTSACSPSRGAA